MDTAEFHSLINDPTTTLKEFCTFRSPAYFSEQITLYELEAPCADFNGFWVLVEHDEDALTDEDFVLLKSYTNHFAWSEGARPPMSDVLDLVYARFGF